VGALPERRLGAHSPWGCLRECPLHLARHERMGRLLCPTLTKSSRTVLYAHPRRLIRSTDWRACRAKWRRHLEHASRPRPQGASGAAFVRDGKITLVEAKLPSQSRVRQYVGSTENHSGVLSKPRYLSLMNIVGQSRGKRQCAKKGRPNHRHRDRDQGRESAWRLAQRRPLCPTSHERRGRPSVS
jgi:hypothetical protein